MFRAVHLIRRPKPELAPIASLSMLLLVLPAALMPAEGTLLPLDLVPAEVRPTQGALPPDQAVLRVRGETFLLNGSRIEASQLVQQLSTVLAGSRYGVVFLDADPNSPYSEVMHIADLVRSAGASAVSFIPDLRDVTLGETTPGETSQTLEPALPQAPTEVAP